MPNVLIFIFNHFIYFFLSQFFFNISVYYLNMFNVKYSFKNNSEIEHYLRSFCFLISEFLLVMKKKNTCSFSPSFFLLSFVFKTLLFIVPQILCTQRQNLLEIIFFCTKKTWKVIFLCLLFLFSTSTKIFTFYFVNGDNFSYTHCEVHFWLFWLSKSLFTSFR